MTFFTDRPKKALLFVSEETKNKKKLSLLLVLKNVPGGVCAVC